MDPTNGIAPRHMTIEDTLHALLDSSREIVSLLGLEVGDHGSERVSSVSFEDMAKGSPKVTTKMYAGSMITRAEVDEALDIHAYAHREAARRQMEEWVETLEERRRQGAPDPPQPILAATLTTEVVEEVGRLRLRQQHPELAQDLEPLPDFGRGDQVARA